MDKKTKGKAGKPANRQKAVQEIRLALLQHAQKHHQNIMAILNDNPNTPEVHYAAFQAVNETLGIIISTMLAQAMLKPKPPTRR